MNRYRVGVALLLILLGARIYRAIFLANFMDLDHFFNWIGAIILGEDPFNELNHHFVQFEIARAPTFPGMTLFIYPLLAMGAPFSYWTWYGLNMALLLILPWILFSWGGVWQRGDSLDRNLFIAFFCAFLFSTSRPVLTALQLGQTSILCTAFIVWCMTSRTNLCRGLGLGLAGALKYSLAGLIGVLFASKKAWKVIFIAGGTFLLFTLTPVIWGHNLVELYGKYIWRLQGFVTGAESSGIDTYWGCNNCLSLTHLDFLKHHGAVLWIKGALVLIFGFILWSDRKELRIGLPLLFVASSLSMTIVYHRHHDLTLPVLWMVGLLPLLLKRGYKGHVFVLSLFIAYFWVPYSILLIFSTWLGGIIGENRWIYLGNAVFEVPLDAVISFFMTFYSIFLYFDLKRLGKMGAKENSVI